jgi:hypothetical protein
MALIIALIASLLLCYGTVKILSIEGVQRLGIWLNVALVVVSISLFAVWYGLNAYSPPISISEHWGMVLISLAGFLSMLLSTVAAVKYLTGVRQGLIALISLGIALVHLVDIVVSIPFS